MVYTEAMSEMITGNTKECADELQDIKSANEMLNQRATKKEIEEKIDSLYEKIGNWDSHGDIYELARWFNELGGLKDDDDIDTCYLFGDCFQKDLYNRIDSVFPLITCDIDGNVLYQDDDGAFIVESVESLSKKHLTLEDKQAVAHILVDKMAWDEQLDEVLKTMV